MIEDLRIVEKKVSIPFIDKQSGRLCAFLEDKQCLENKYGETISLEYYCMLDLGDDHYAVCDIVSHVMFYTRNDYYSVVKGEYKIINEPTFKWGIIRIKRDINGKVIPMGETVVVPFIYDRICNNNSKTATVYCGQHLTYVELDVNSSCYGKQLVPCI